MTFILYEGPKPPYIIQIGAGGDLRGRFGLENGIKLRLVRIRHASPKLLLSAPRGVAPPRTPLLLYMSSWDGWVHHQLLISCSHLQSIRASPCRLQNLFEQLEEVKVSMNGMLHQRKAILAWQKGLTEYPRAALKPAQD
eukprot:1161589-Pelagomonas_calceolata.AAC.2